MVKVEKIVFLGKHLKVGLNMVELHDRVKGQFRNYSYLIKLVKKLECKKALKLEKVGRECRIREFNKGMFQDLDSILKLAR